MPPALDRSGHLKQGHLYIARAERSSYGISRCIEVGERRARSAEQVRFFGEEAGVLAMILGDVLLRIVDVAIRCPDTQRRDARSLGLRNDATVNDSVLI